MSFICWYNTVGRRCSLSARAAQHRPEPWACQHVRRRHYRRPIPPFLRSLSEPSRLRLLHTSGSSELEETSDKATDVFTDSNITSEPLAPELQQIVDEHIKTYCRAPLRERHIVRHWRLDSRKCLKKSKKKALKYEFTVTPFFIIGAYRVLVDRAVQRQQQQRNNKKDLAARNILNANIPFEWFQLVANKLTKTEAGAKDLDVSKFGKKSTDSCKLLILHETMAMLMRPLITPHLPPHAWCLSNDTKYIPESFKQKIESMARNSGDTKQQHWFLFWDLGVDDGHVALTQQHMKIINNMAYPYAPHWWVETLFKLFNFHARGPSKKRRQWIVTDGDDYSSLPALLVDMLLLRVDHSENLKRHPLWSQMKQLLASDKKKQKLGIVKPRNLPHNIKDSAHMEYHRLGPLLLVTYRGPEGLREKVRKAVDLELKSGLMFDKRLVDNRAFSLVEPKRRNDKEMAKYEAAYTEHKKIFDIAAAGTKKTRNRARLRLQEEGRLSQKENDQEE